MKKLFFLFAFFSALGAGISTVSASWWDDLKGMDDDYECVIDFDMGSVVDFGSGAEPVFNGPGIEKGAKLVKCNLDKQVSKEKDLRVLLIGWMKFLLSLTAVVAVVALVWAGVLYVTAMGDDGRIETAKKVVLWTVIGIVLILGAYAIVNSVMKVGGEALETKKYNNETPLYNGNNPAIPGDYNLGNGTNSSYPNPFN